MLEPYRNRRQEDLFMIGTTREEITELNKIDLIDYLRKTDSNNIRTRKNGTITHKSKDNLVIWNDHSYDFGTTINPYKDVIGTLRIIYGYDFMQAINKLRDFKTKNNQNTKTDKKEIPHYNIFDFL